MIIIFIVELHFSWICVIVISVDLITFGPDLVLTAKNKDTSLFCVFKDCNCKNISSKVVRIQTSAKEGLERKYLSFSPPVDSNVPQKSCCAFASIRQILLITTASKILAN